METSTKQQQQFIYSNRKTTNNNNNNNNKYNNNSNNNNHNNNNHIISDYNNNENMKYIYDQQDKFKMVDNKTNKTNSAPTTTTTTNALSSSNNNNTKQHEFIKSIKLIEKQIQSNTTLNQKHQHQQQQQQNHGSQQSLQQQHSLSDEKINDENRVQPIWKKFNYDPDTSIYLIKREKIEKFIQAKAYLAIAQRTKCKIQLYLNNDMSGTVYFTVNGTYESRCNALEQLRDETGKAGVIVNLPSLTKPNSILKKQNSTTITSSTSPRAHLNLKFNSYEDYDGDTSINKTTNNNNNNTNNKKNATTPTAASSSSTSTSSKGVSFKRTKSFHSKLTTTINNDYQQPPQTPQPQQLPSQQFLNDLANRRMYSQQISNSSTTSSSSTSTSTSTSPSSLSSSNSTSPTSFQQQYSTIDTLIPTPTPKDSTKQNQQQQKLSDKNSNTQTKPTTTTTTATATTRAKQRYTLDFLLSRADDIQSKELPKNWPELNNKYPNICFCGRVISYFNPHKYQAYWDKIKEFNQHLHVSTTTTTTTQ